MVLRSAKLESRRWEKQYRWLNEGDVPGVLGTQIPSLLLKPSFEDKTIDSQ